METSIKFKEHYKKGIGVLEENRLGNIKKKLKVKGLAKGDRRAGLFTGSTTSIWTVSASS